MLVSPSVIHIKERYYAGSLSRVVGATAPSYSLRSCAVATECNAVSEVRGLTKRPPVRRPLVVRGGSERPKVSSVFLQEVKCFFQWPAPQAPACRVSLRIL